MLPLLNSLEFVAFWSYIFLQSSEQWTQEQKNTLWNWNKMFNVFFVNVIIAFFSNGYRKTQEQISFSGFWTGGRNVPNSGRRRRWSWPLLSLQGILKLCFLSNTGAFCHKLKHWSGVSDVKSGLWVTRGQNVLAQCSGVGKFKASKSVKQTTVSRWAVVEKLGENAWYSLT